MKDYISLGKLLKELREKKNESLSDIANAIEKDRSYIFKLESGQGRPSIEVLNALIRHFTVSDINLIKQLFEKAGYPNPVVAMPDNATGVQTQNLNLPIPSNAVQINLPSNTPILYTDSAFITTSNVGFVFDFAQSQLGSNNQTIVSRVGLSLEHAKLFLKVLNRKIEEAHKSDKQIEKKDN